MIMTCQNFLNYRASILRYKNKYLLAFNLIFFLDVLMAYFKNIKIY